MMYVSKAIFKCVLCVEVGHAFSVLSTGSGLQGLLFNCVTNDTTLIVSNTKGDYCVADLVVVSCYRAVELRYS